MSVLHLILTTTCEVFMVIAILQKLKLRLRNANNLLKITQPEGSGTNTRVKVPLTLKPNYFFSFRIYYKMLNILKGL